MALQFVGSTSGAGTSNGYTVSLSGTLTGGIASSPAAGDLVLVVSAFGNTASSAPNVSGNNSGAYTGFQAAVHVNDTWDTEFRTFYAVMGSSPDTSLTITRTTNTAYGGATVVMVYRGQGASPIAFNSTVATITNGSRAVTPNATLTATDQWVVSFGAGTQGTTGSAFTVPTQLTGNSRSVKADGSTSDIGVWAANVAPNTTGSFTISAPTGGTTSTSSSGAAHTVVIAPVVDHTTTGGLSGSGSEVVGSADRQSAAVAHTSTGALTGQIGSVGGSAERFRAFSTTGVLPGQTATITGSADREAASIPHVAAGVLLGQEGTVVGSAARTRVHTTDGTLSGGAATITGDADHEALAVPHIASGILVGQDSTVTGTGFVSHLHATAGVLVGPGATITGDADLESAAAHDATGDLVGSNAIVVGSAAHISLYPDPSDVRAGVIYGPGGIYVGTLTVGAGETIIRLRSFTERF